MRGGVFLRPYFYFPKMIDLEQVSKICSFKCGLPLVRKPADGTVSVGNLFAQISARSVAMS
jgi:hypothetical protein